jgi:hypothetical protein
LVQIGVALGGAAGTKFAGKLAMMVSSSTRLRRLHLDDWTFRKGRNYGTIIVDDESGSPSICSQTGIAKRFRNGWKSIRQ